MSCQSMKNVKNYCSKLETGFNCLSYWYSASTVIVNKKLLSFVYEINTDNTLVRVLYNQFISLMFLIKIGL